MDGKTKIKAGKDNENLLYITGNSTHCPAVTYMGRKSKKRRYM